MEIVIFHLFILLFSVVVHEVSHGIIAESLGDPTARLAGRLTLNPLKHLDPFGSVIVPLLLSLVPGGVVFGWARPVPYNPANLKRPERDGALVAVAGPASNIALAVIFALLFRLLGAVPLSYFFTVLRNFLPSIVAVNVALAVFNLVPIPPLDGSRVLGLISPRLSLTLEALSRQYGFLLILPFIFFGIWLIEPIIIFLYNLLI